MSQFLVNQDGLFNHNQPQAVDTVSEVAMNALKYLSFVGKIAGLVSALNVIPFVDPKIGVIVFASASLLKDAVNRIGDLLDDGQPNASFKS
ncbi:hypothetical protein HQ447_13730 [bacterium]|nr:hypothetical protein [bacterium]